MLSDLLHSFREFRKRPALTATAVLSLALGIGATTAVFTVIYAVLGNTLYLLLGAVASLLLIGCGNVPILLLARGIERRHEFAARVAVGAGRSRILRQMFTESLVIAIAGSAIGLFIA